MIVIVIIDGMGFIGVVIGFMFIGFIIFFLDDWNYVFYMFYVVDLCVGLFLTRLIFKEVCVMFVVSVV